MLKPTNKTSAGEGKMHYLSKMRYLFLSETNLVETDLLRGGVPTATANIEPSDEFRREKGVRRAAKAAGE